jgi:hypothetical protein
MEKELHMEIHVHKLGKGRKFKVCLTDGASVVQEEVVSGIKSRDELVWKWCDLYSTVDIIIHEEKKKEFKYSEIPSIPVLEEEDAEEFFDENEDFVYGRIAQAVHEGIATDATELRLFELNGTEQYITSKRENWEAGLRSALLYFEKNEKYEMCEFVMRLIEQL